METVLHAPEESCPDNAPARLGKLVVSMLVLGLILGLSYQVTKRGLLLPSRFRDFFGLGGMLCLVISGWLVIRRVYAIRRIVNVFALGSALLLLTQVTNVVEEFGIFGQMHESIRKLCLNELPLFAGIALILAGFYMCVLETDAAKKRLAQHAAQLARQIKERERAENELRQSEANFRTLTETTPAATLIHKGDKYLYANQTAARFTGFSKEEICSQNFLQAIHPDFREIVKERTIARLKKETPPTRYEIAFITKDGQKRWVDLSVGSIQYEGEPAILGAFFDITDRKNAEEAQRATEAQVQRTQKLESLGILAGGIAHDFNNLLMGILGNADLALLELPTESRVRENLKGIENAARRAADLARQMLAYSGKGRFIVEPIDIGAVLAEIGHLIAASVSKKAVLNYNLAPNLPAIDADATQIRQVFMNLITNASEALEDKNGTITVSTGVMQCDRHYLRGTHLDEELPEGLYVYCEVSDTGCGMDPKTRTRIFDPFFTTKFTGRGLGLAAVLGIVRGHRGAICVYSEPGHGTTVKILFPVTGRAAISPAEQTAPEVTWRGKGTVLLVDDEETVRTVGRQMLERAGFDVLMAEDGRQALEIFRRQPNDIACVLLDLTMPNMDGEETFRELRRVKDDVRVILSSGYNEQEAVNRFTLKDLAGFIQKPYQYSNLAQKLQQVLETNPQPERMA
jgi:two-component system cell cycle sensor histidine kinase/response regulator CckA